MRRTFGCGNLIVVGLPSGPDDQLVRVVLLDELASTTNGDLVHQVEEVLGREVGRVDGLGMLDVLPDARDAQRGEAGVVADEVLDQRLEVGRASC